MKRLAEMAALGFFVVVLYVVPSGAIAADLALDTPISATYAGTTSYTLNLTAGQGVPIALSAHLQSGSLNFGLYDSNNVLLVASNDSTIANGETGAAYKAVYKSGVYTVKVSGTAVGSYDLVVYNAWFNAGVTDDQRGFYSTDDSSKYLQNGNHPVDPLGTVYRFTVQENVPLTVTFAPHLNSGSLGVALYDAAWSDLGSDGFVYNGETRVISKTILKSGVYFVWVWGSAPGNYDLTVTGADADRDSDSDGLYDAVEYWHGTNVNAADSDGDGVSDYAELEQGNNPRVATEYAASAVSGATTRATAVPIPYFDKKFHADHPGTSTWYAVNLAAGQGITVVFSPRLQYGALGCSIYNASGTDLGGGDTSVYSGETLIIDKTVASAGTYYIQVWGSAPGDYDLAVYNAWSNPGVIDSQRDFYSTYNTARSMQNGRYAANPLGQVYRLELTAGQGISLAFSPHLHYGSMGCAMYDATGADLGGRDGFVYNGETLKIDKTVVKSGVYYVKVWGSAPGSYDLAVSGVVLPDFSHALVVNKSGTGSGIVSGTGISCNGNECTGNFSS